LFGEDEINTQNT